MRTFHIAGTIEITYTWQVSEDIEVEDEEGEDEEGEDEAWEAVIEELDPITALTTDTDTFACVCTEVDYSAEQREAERVAELHKLQEWNAWARGQAVSQ